MKFKRKDTNIIYDVTNPEVLPLFEDNEAYEVIVEKKEAEKKTAPKKTSK